MKASFTETINRILSRPGAATIVAVLLFLPLLFLGTHSSHDWGDDFAQYIHQAGNIVHHVPQSETGYVYSAVNFVGPKAYPVGFPLLLAPVYAIFGNNMTAFTTFVSICYIVLGLFMVVLYKRYFSAVTALVLTVIFLFNPQMLIFKREVMSDIPFTALLVLNFILYARFKNGEKMSLVILAVVVGALLAVRPTGIVFVAAVLLEQLVLFIRKKSNFKEAAQVGAMFVFVPVLVYFVVNSFIFKIPSGGSIRDYLAFYYSGNFLQIIPENFLHHLEVFRYLYIPEAGIFNGFSVILGSVMVVMTLLGFIKRMVQGPEVMEWFFIFYILMLLLFPNNDSAYRLMVPLGFMFLFYAAIGFRSVQIAFEISSQTKALVVGGIILLLFLPGIVSIARLGDHVLDGPQQKSSVEAFSYISKNVPADSVVMFAKPRALALYGGCRSLADPFTTDPTLIHVQVMKAKVTYLLINESLSADHIKCYARVMLNRMTKKWENKDFVLYKINPINPSARR